jgi:hypothetical protein
MVQRINNTLLFFMVPALNVAYAGTGSSEDSIFFYLAVAALLGIIWGIGWTVRYIKDLLSRNNGSNGDLMQQPEQPHSAIKPGTDERDNEVRHETLSPGLDLR